MASRRRDVVLLLLLAPALAALPPPLSEVCLPTTQAGCGCYNDSFTRTFPHQMNDQSGDPFYDNSTQETCAYLCATALAPGPFPVAAVENGGQCFCGTAADLAKAQANCTDESRCSAPCNGNPLSTCGGTWAVQAFEYACSPYEPGTLPWLNSSLPIAARVTDLISRLSDVALVAQLTQNGADIYARGVQLPRYIVSQECLAGYDGGQIYLAPPLPTTPSSGFPQPVNMGNTFDADLVREIASAISDEARAAFVHAGRPSLVCMSPNLNLCRDPRWGRNVESFGEEPALLATLGTAYITGIQMGVAANASAAASGFIKIAAVPKHLGAYSVECFNKDGSANDYPNCEVYRNTYNAVVDQLDLRESYFPAWQAAIMEANASGVMCSYNEINGVPSCCNGELLRDTLEGDWGLSDGFVISDADAVASEGFVPDQGVSVGGHNYTSSLLESAIASLINGTSISLEDTNNESAAYVLELPRALALGRIVRSDLEETARRALTPRFRTGLYEPAGTVPWDAVPASVIESAAHHALARRAAAESFVLLSNINRTLPLADPAQGGPSNIAVIGSVADCASCQVNRYSGSPNVSVSFYAGIRNAALARGAAAVTLTASFDAAAVAAVNAADLAIVVFTSQDEGESKDRQHIALPDEQVAFLAALAAAGSTTPVVAVIASGGAVDSGPAIAISAAAIAVYMGGMESGNGLADVLYGVVNPSGALAHTVYRSSWEEASDFLSMAIRAPPGRGRRYLTPEAVAQHVLFPFGFGLSYTTWFAEVASVTPSTISSAALQAGNVSVLVTVRNTGEVAGSRVSFFLLTRSAPDPAEQWPGEWLPRAGFTKLHGVEPGAAATATLFVAARDLARWDATAHAFTVRPGTYTLAARDGAPGAKATLVVTA